MEIMEVVKAFFLLKAANMREHSDKLGRATSTFEIKKMREKIIKILKHSVEHLQLKRSLVWAEF